MTKERYDRLLAIRERYRPMLVGEDTVIPVDKAELMDLLQAGLERGDKEVQFDAGFAKLMPKAAADGTKSLEIGFSMPFNSDFLSHVGELFGTGCHVIVEQNVRAEAIEKKPEPTPESLNLPLPFEDGSPQEAPVNHTSPCPACGGIGYRGANSEDSCEDCGGTGVVVSQSPVDQRVDCPACSGAGNIPDDEGYLGPCLDCHGTGKVEQIPQADVEAAHEAGDDEAFTGSETRVPLTR